MFDVMPQTVLLSVVPQDARPNTPERNDHRDLSGRVSGGRIKNPFQTDVFAVPSALRQDDF